MSITDDSAEDQTPEVDVDASQIAPETESGPELEPVAEEQAKTYRVAGPHPVHDTRPGETFTAVLDPGQEAFLLTVGHIEIVEPTPGDITQ